MEFEFELRKLGVDEEVEIEERKDLSLSFFFPCPVFPVQVLDWSLYILQHTRIIHQNPREDQRSKVKRIILEIFYTTQWNQSASH